MQAISAWRCRPIQERPSKSLRAPFYLSRWSACSHARCALRVVGNAQRRAWRQVVEAELALVAVARSPTSQTSLPGR